MSEQSNILDTVKTKLIQAATSTTSAEGREAIRKDIQKLLTQVDNISEQTTYNGINLLNEKGAEFSFQVGEDQSFDIGLQTAYAVNTAGLGSAGKDGSTSADIKLTSAGVTLEGEVIGQHVELRTTTGSITITGQKTATTESEVTSDSSFNVNATNVSGFL
jgi:flagellin